MRLLPLVAFVACVLTARAAEQIPASSQQISIEGRTAPAGNGALRLGYPGIVTRIHFSGTELAASVATRSDEAFFDVSIDGGAYRFLHVAKGSSSVKLAAGLPEGEHTATLFKRVESCVAEVELQSFHTDGRFLSAPALSARRLLVLGDSFTCGQTATHEDGEPIVESKAMRQNARLSYGRLLADRLGAQVHIIAYAGKGLLRDWQGKRDPRCAPVYYPLAIPEDDATTWDPARYQPQVILVCVGQNDFDTSLPAEPEFSDAYTAFVTRLLADAPGARVFLLTAPCLTDSPEPKHAAQLATFRAIAARFSDGRVSVVDLPRTPPVPNDGHPSGTAHRRIADLLEPLVREAL